MFPIQAARLGAWLRHPAAAPALSCSASAESDVPDVPNSDEPYDYRFTKWMVKNKVNGSGPFCCPGWVCAHSAHPSSWLGAWSSPTLGHSRLQASPRAGTSAPRASSSQGLAAIPLSAFYSEAHKNNYTNFIRFCFAKVR